MNDCDAKNCIGHTILGHPVAGQNPTFIFKKGQEGYAPLIVLWQDLKMYGVLYLFVTKLGNTRHQINEFHDYPSA